MKNIKPSLFILTFIIVIKSSLGQSFLFKPIVGQYGKDYIIVNYVDWGLENSITDFACLSKTYNGHQGTDYVIKNFKTMDSGIYVLAAAAGKVFFTKDGEFDREKTADTSKKLGNYIGISHDNGYQTYYGHLKNNSLLVSNGQMVSAGQRIAKVGSSGNSSDPHLHFEVWYDSTFYVDPFNGNCGNANTLFINPELYDSSFNIWLDGMCNYIPTLDSLREQPMHIDTFTNIDEAINYWSILYGLRKGDELKIEWYQPNGSLWFDYSLTLDKDYWYYYYWSYIIYQESQPLGDWKVILKRNGNMVAERNFSLHIKHIGNINNSKNQNSIKVINHEQFIEFEREHAIGDIFIYNILGQNIQQFKEYVFDKNYIINKSYFNRGYYLFIFKNKLNNQTETIKFQIN